MVCAAAAGRLSARRSYSLELGSCGEPLGDRWDASSSGERCDESRVVDVDVDVDLVVDVDFDGDGDGDMAGER
jgi:hypothetical protein